MLQFLAQYCPMILTGSPRFKFKPGRFNTSVPQNSAYRISRTQTRCLSEIEFDDDKLLCDSGDTTDHQVHAPPCNSRAAIYVSLGHISCSFDSSSSIDSFDLLCCLGWELQKHFRLIELFAGDR